MLSTTQQVKNIILKYKCGVSKRQIARELNFSLDYTDFICRDLKRRGEIVFSNRFYSLVSAKEFQNRMKSPNDKSKFDLFSIPKITKGLIQMLKKAGYKNIESLADAPIARLMQETKLPLPKAAGLINRARKALKKIGKEIKMILWL